ncbi:Coenzyme F420 hydrogenase/dehydrogenase, beta subunit C-terminal domain [Exiguobacterium sp. s151]|uniref:Coenzyme F420 hydrogenase/dehydrogenase, beta subunit C-terminal domain n=1 Tax=Exiguobacterium sp. s151 TaxID=2751229 RepID=UPI001BEBB140|nr:Coenzyme F420 hydrogenase/dehydrogenase, beta subunit C-terminal domain [Exiguobacterium sp. s151]
MNKVNKENIAFINNYSYATGAYAVINKNIAMELDEFGEYKYIEKECFEMDSSKFNIDLNEDKISRDLFAKNPNIKYDARVGYYQKIYAGHVIEGDFRKNASSGGFGTWIFKELFEKRLIDGVIHVKENKDKESPILFKYDISKSIEEIKAGAKTRYYPVEFSQVINKIKEKPGNYAIIGTPSFIMSIRLLARQDPVVNERIKYTIGLICGHQKSSKFADCLAWQVGIEPGNLKSINFRKKIPNFPANRYGVEITGLVKGKEITITKHMSEMIGHNWGQGFFKSYASDFTDDVMNETADVTLGDAWLPEYTEDSDGNNVILVRDDTILKIIEDGIATNKIKINEISVDTIVKSQASHFQHTQNELGYRLYKKDKAGEWRPETRVQASNDIPYFRRKIQDLRMEISKQSHTSFHKAVQLNDFNYFVNRMNKYTRKYDRIYYISKISKKGPKDLISKIFNKILMKLKVK